MSKKRALKVGGFVVGVGMSLGYAAYTYVKKRELIKQELIELNETETPKTDEKSNLE